MRIAIMGQAAFGAKVLETLADRGEQVIAAWLPQGKAGAKPDPLQIAAEQRRDPRLSSGKLQIPGNPTGISGVESRSADHGLRHGHHPPDPYRDPVAGVDLLPPLAPPPPPRRERDQLGRDHGGQRDGAFHLLGGRRDRHGADPPPEAGPHRSGGYHRIALLQPALPPRRRGDCGVRRSHQGGAGAPSRPGRKPRHL